MALPPTPAEETVFPIPCKVNLRLAVGDRRPSGYHDIETFFLPLPEPADTMRVRRFDEPGDIDFTCSDPELETEDNLVVRAYRAYGAATGFSPRLEVVLTKHIPHGAGLGGGSSDAAALLRYVNDRAGQAALAASDLASLALDILVSEENYQRIGINPFLLMGE